MVTPDNHISQSHNCTITITPDNYISEMISQVGGFCALSGVFILTLPIPIVVNRFLKIDLTYIAMMPVISQPAWRWFWDANILIQNFFSFAMYYKNRLWRTEVSRNVFFLENWMKKSKKVAHKKRERTRQQASELKEMQKFLLIKVEHIFGPWCCHRSSSRWSTQTIPSNLFDNFSRFFLLVKVKQTNSSFVLFNIKIFWDFSFLRRWWDQAST